MSNENTTNNKEDKKNNENHVAFISNEEIDTKIQRILLQTDYSDVEAMKKLQHYSYDEFAVIREYLGIPDKPVKGTSRSVNQEIYKQIRSNLDTAIREYNIRKENKEQQQIFQKQQK